MSLQKNLSSILFMFFLTCSLFLYGQKIKIIVKNSDSLSLQLLKVHDLQTVYKNKKEALIAVEKLKLNLEKSGFLNPLLTLSKHKDGKYSFSLKDLKKFDSIRITIPKEIPQRIISRTSNTITLPFKGISLFISNVNNQFELLGNPFTQTKLINLKSQHNKIWANLKISNHKSRRIDKTIFKDYKKFPLNYKKQFLQLHKPIAFNKRNILKIKNKLKRLTFINQFKEPEFLFTKDSTFLYLYVNKKKVNQFDGLIGFNSNKNGNLIFNGHLDISLKNNFNKGETISLTWSNNGNEQQDLDLKITTPYIYSSILSPEINLKIRKQDSTFINTSFIGKIHFDLVEKHKIGAIIKNESSRSNLVITNNNVQNFTKTSYGIEHSYKLYENDDNSIIKTHIYSSFEFATRKFDTEQQNQNAYSVSIEQNFRLASKSSLNIKNTSKILDSENILFNELFQIGGATTIRGFNEKSIFASSYNYSNLEYRIRTGKLSYLYSFSDIGFTKNSINNLNTTLTSFGLGYSFKTKTGIIDLNYSLGKTNNTKFEFDKGLFHIKFVNLF